MYAVCSLSGNIGCAVCGIGLIACVCRYMSLAVLHDGPAEVLLAVACSDGAMRWVEEGLDLTLNYTIRSKKREAASTH